MLKQKFQCNLPRPCVAGCRRNRPKGRVSDRTIRIGKIRCICQIVEFTPRLKFNAFPDVKPTEQREIILLQRRTANGVSAYISELVRRRWGERRGRKPLSKTVRVVYRRYLLAELAITRAIARCCI